VIVTVAALKERLDENLQRVEILVELFDQLEPRGDLTKTDTLRAAVVFLHATLEDVVRTALELRLPQASPEQLGLAFAAGKSKANISMIELARHRGKSVDDIIGERIDAYLARSNFNDVANLIAALERIELEASLLDPHKDDLAGMMKRRHWIVHRADHSQEARGPGPIAVKTVTTWKDAVSAFCYALLARLASI
jgi:hypothetical protein